MYKIILALLVSLLQLGCKEEPPVKPPDNGVTPKITLTGEDAACTEVWLSVKVDTLPSLAEISLFKDEELLFNITGTNLATLLYEENLIPGSTYLYRVKVNYKEKEYSDSIAVTTLQPTSQNFTWQTFTFGDHSNSILRDVVVIDENNIWAVGEIYVADTSENGYTMYNAVHWDGNEWELKRIMFYTFCPQGTVSGSYPAKSIFAFDNENIVMSSGSQIAYLQNGVQVKKECVPVSVNKIWGTSVNDFYIVGYGGGIAHWNGSNWKKIESGTSLHIYDIWGVPNNNNNYNKYCGSFEYLIKIDATNKVSLINFEKSPSILSVWGLSDRLLYVAGGTGLSLYKNYMWEKIDRPDVNTIYGIRGTDYNNIFGLSSTCSILHFNGYNWQFIDLPQNNSKVRLNVKSNLIATVGWQGEKALIIILRRN